MYHTFRNSILINKSPKNHALLHWQHSNSQKLPHFWQLAIMLSWTLCRNCGFVFIWFIVIVNSFPKLLVINNQTNIPNSLYQVLVILNGIIEEFLFQLQWFYIWSAYERMEIYHGWTCAAMLLLPVSFIHLICAQTQLNLCVLDLYPLSFIRWCWGLYVLLWLGY